MAFPIITKSDDTLDRYSVFAVTFGVIFCIFYLFVMNYGWQLFTYYPASNQWVLYGHPPAGASPGPAMKWYGYVASAALVAAVVGLVASMIPAQTLWRIWWPGLIWVVPILATIVLFYLIVAVGD
jgi:hypothetical protein